MKKLILLSLLFPLLLFSGCVSSQRTEKIKVENFSSSMTIQEELDIVFADFSSYGGSVCMGMSGPYTDKTKAIQVATENCLQYLAFSKTLVMQADYETTTSSTTTDKFHSQVFGGTSDTTYNDVASEIEIVNIKWYGDKVGAVVFARIASSNKVNWNQNQDWIDKTPVIPGYNVAVASSEKTYSSLVSAIEAATFRAAEQLLNEDKTTVNVDNSITKTTQDSYKNDSYSISGNKFIDFTILDYKYDAKTGKIFALVVSKQR